MKSQKWGLVVILILAVCSLPFSRSGFGQVQVQRAPEPAELLSLMKINPDAVDKIGKESLEEAKKSLARQIAYDFEAMKLLFETKDFCCLAKLLGKRGVVLTTPGFEKICGGGSAEFWQGVWKEGLELNFKAVSVVVSGAITPQPVPLCTLIEEGIPIKDAKGNPVLYNAVAYLVFEFHIVPKNKTGTYHNQTGGGGGTYRHKTGCPWG